MDRKNVAKHGGYDFYHRGHVKEEPRSYYDHYSGPMPPRPELSNAYYSGDPHDRYPAPLRGGSGGRRSPIDGPLSPHFEGPSGYHPRMRPQPREYPDPDSYSDSSDSDYDEEDSIDYPIAYVGPGDSHCRDCRLTCVDPHDEIDIHTAIQRRAPLQRDQVYGFDSDNEEYDTYRRRPSSKRGKSYGVHRYHLDTNPRPSPKRGNPYGASQEVILRPEAGRSHASYNSQSRPRLLKPMGESDEIQYHGPPTSRRRKHKTTALEIDAQLDLIQQKLAELKQDEHGRSSLEAVNSQFPRLL